MAKSQIDSRFVPPPIKGMSFLHNMVSGNPEYAQKIEGLICTPEGLEAPVFDLASNLGVTSHGMIFAHHGEKDKMFFTTAFGIYHYASPGVSLYALTTGIGQATSFSTGAGKYTFFVNGTATGILIYDGTTWSAAAVTGSAGPHVACTAYRRRMFFAHATSLELQYLAVDAIAGAFSTYTVGSLFSRGGKIASITTLSRDSGFGPDDFLLVYTTAGEVAIFSGNDPAAASWSVVGVYYVGVPACGPFQQAKVMAQVGGDVWLYTTGGIFSMKSVMSGTGAPESVSKHIDPLLLRLLRENGLNKLPTISYLPSRRLVIITGPNLLEPVFVYSIDTGGWSITSWDYYTGLRSFIEATDLVGNTACYALQAPDNAKIWSVFATSGAVTTQQGDFKLNTLYSRFDSLDRNLSLQVRPIFISNTNRSIPFGSAIDLSNQYSSGTVLTTNRPSVSRFAGWEADTGTQPGKLIHDWLTVAASDALCVSFRMTGTFSAEAPSSFYFRYLGMDLRHALTSPVG